MQGTSTLAGRVGNDVRRVLIVDDSAVARAVIARALATDATFAVAGSVPSANAALAFLKNESVDFVLLDIEMPGIDGLTALPEIIAAAPAARVIVVTSSQHESVDGTVQALALGAVDRVQKPMLGGLASGFAQRLLDKMAALSREPVSPPVIAPRPPRVAPRPEGFNADAFDVVAIGASTGGIHALSALLRELPREMTLPILITQHLPESFMAYFAAQIATMARRPCDVATDRMRVRPGRIVVAPGDAHLHCVRLRDRSAAIRLVREPAASGCLPSVDPMLASLAQVFGDRVLAVMLSGMGRDGAEGARSVCAAGGRVLAQDRATSVVWGMPGAVAGIADALLPPEAIGTLIAGCRAS